MGYYDEISRGYNQLHGEEQLKKAVIIKAHIKPREEEKLLDVGCGTGITLDVFDCRVLGIDPAKELLAQYKGKHKVYQASAENLPFKDKQFDIVISITAIHNFNDIEKGLREIERVGKDRYALSILKRSPKFEWIEHEIEQLFAVQEQIEQDLDIIFFCRKKGTS